MTTHHDLRHGSDPDHVAALSHPLPSGDQRGLHTRLARFNARRLSPSEPTSSRAHDQEDRLLIGLQDDFVDRESAKVFAQAQAVPTDPSAFIAWFTSLDEHGPGQQDPLFPWLAESASLDEMRWFVRQEAAGEAGFDDLIALTQIKLPVRAKLEMARNYWDEMGHGEEAGMHGRLLDRLVRHLGVSASVDATVWESLAVGNLMVALATQRHLAYQSIGALGVIELTAPGRVSQVAEGLRRLEVPKPERAYFDIHATLDRKHSRAWNEEIIAPLVAENPQRAVWIAEGALMRLAAGARCFDCYRNALSVEAAAMSSGR